MEGLRVPCGRPEPLCPLQRIAPCPTVEQSATARTAEPSPSPSRRVPVERSPARDRHAAPAATPSSG
eukprot:11164061-Alexandrium_andersonii.AAC.1